MKVPLCCGADYRLPTQVDIRLQNGFRSFAPVCWEEEVDTTACGVQTVYGRAEYGGEVYGTTAFIEVRLA